MKIITHILRPFLGFILLLALGLASFKTQAQLPVVPNYQLDSLTTTDAYLSWDSLGGASSYTLDYDTDLGSNTFTTANMSITIARTTGAKTEAWIIAGVDMRGQEGEASIITHGSVIVVDELIIAPSNNGGQPICNEFEILNEPSLPFYIKEVSDPLLINPDICICTLVEEICNIENEYYALYPFAALDWEDTLYDMGINNTNPDVMKVDCQGIGEPTHTIRFPTNGQNRRGIKEQSLFEWTAYPNPFSNHISVNIKSEVTATPELILLDIMGRKLSQVQMEKLSSQWSAKISTDQLKSGIYNIVLRVGDKIYQKRIVK